MQFPCIIVYFIKVCKINVQNVNKPKTQMKQIRDYNIIIYKTIVRIYIN